MPEPYPQNPRQLTEDQAILLYTKAFPEDGGPNDEDRQGWAQAIRDCLCAETPDKAVFQLEHAEFRECVTIAFKLWDQATENKVTPKWVKL